MSDDADRLKEQADAFGRLWTDFASRMAASGLFSPGEAPSPQAARHLRDAMFDAMSKYADQFMRSPEFLEQIKQSFDGAIEFRKQLNAFLGELHHGVQGVSLQDAQGLFRAIEDLQTQVADRIGRVSERLDVIESRLAATPPTKRTAKPPSPGRRLQKAGKKRKTTSRAARTSASRTRRRK